MTTNNNQPETFDCTPTWAQILPSMLLILRDSDNKKDKLTIIEELQKMAKAADLWNDHIKNS